MDVPECAICKNPTLDFVRICQKCEPKKLKNATSMFLKKYNLNGYSPTKPSLDYGKINKHVEGFSNILLELLLWKEDALDGGSATQKNKAIQMCFEYVCLFEYFDIILKLDEDLEVRSTWYQIELAYLEIIDFICESALSRKNIDIFFPNTPRESFDYTSWENEVKKMHKGIDFDIWCHHQTTAEHFENCRNDLSKNIDTIHMQYKLTSYFASANRLTSSFNELAHVHMNPEESLLDYFSQEFDLIDGGLTGIYSRVSHPASFVKSSSLLTISKLMDISLAKFKYIDRLDLKKVALDLNYLYEMGQNILQLSSTLPTNELNKLKSKFLQCCIHSSFIIKDKISTSVEATQKLTADNSTQILHMYDARDVSSSIIHYSSASDLLQKYMRDTSRDDGPLQKFFIFLKYIDMIQCDNKPTILFLQKEISNHSWVFEQEYVIACYQIKQNLQNLFSRLDEKNRLGVVSRYKEYTTMKKWHYRLYKLLGIETSIMEEGRRGAPVDILFSKQNIKNKNNVVQEKEHLADTFQNMIRKISSILPPVIAPPVIILVIFDHLLQFTRCSFSVFEARDYLAFQLFTHLLEQYLGELLKSDQLEFRDVIRFLASELKAVLEQTSETLFSKQDVIEIQLILNDVFSTIADYLHFPPSCGLVY